jgi:bifunctional DNA-binding transcriptional regulator/antitoxin component of YhaV-PrlF toxin-antitoxin module
MALLKRGSRRGSPFARRPFSTGAALPKEIRNLLKAAEGNRSTFICEGDYAIMMNANIYVIMRTLQKEMAGNGKKPGIKSEEDVVEQG